MTSTASRSFLVTAVFVSFLCSITVSASTNIQGCQIFPDTNPWNQDISALPVHSNSANYIAYINAGGKTALHPDFGTGGGIPFVVVPGTQAMVPINFTVSPDESDPGPYPVPANAPIEGNGAPGDRHVLVLDKDNAVLYEMYNSSFTNPGWSCNNGAVFDLKSNTLRPDGFTSSDAAGLPVLAGLARYDETSAGAITHALRFTVRATAKSFIHPATHYASTTTDPNAPPMGLRLRLKASYSLAGLTGQALIVATALKKYGLIVADNGSDWYITGEQNASWNDTELNQLKNIPGNMFEAVQTGTPISVSSSPQPPPTITTPPASQTVSVGQTATFNVVANGTGTIQYQWQKNGADILGARIAAYTTPAAVAGDNGSLFRCVVSTAGGTVNSAAATLTVSGSVTPPSITTQPANQTVTAGQTATFSVVASGTGPLSYQWQKGTTNIGGATSASYTTPITTIADSGTTYRCVVTNTAGSATSNSATLTVNAAPTPPSITTQPANQTVTAGQTATFSVVASGTGPLSYQWQKGTTNIGGATSASYTTPITTIADSGTTYRCVVTNTAGSATSNSATLTVNAAPTPPSITTQPANQTVTAGQTATFSVVASGTGPLSYQWQKGTTNIGGATSASYTTPITTIADSGTTYRCVVTNTAGSATSNSATLTVNAAPTPPSITTQPVNKTVSAGQTATFSVVASGTGPLSYQWQKGTTNIGGATSASYTTPATVAGDNGTTYRCVVTNTAGSATSNAATLTVNVLPSITTQPVNQSVVVGQTATFSVVAAGTNPLSYQWQKNSVNIGGATNASYTTPATVIGDNGALFRCVVTNVAGSATSNAATLTVTAAPVAPSITSQPASQTVTVGQTATFSVTATGAAPLTYQWQKNSANIAGATSAAYTTPATVLADNGATFRCVATNSAGSATSNAATLTVRAAPTLASITVTPASATIKNGQTQAFSATALDQFGATLVPQPAFTWSVSGGGAINGTGLFTASSGGTFTVSASSGVISGSAKITVTSPPTITSPPGASNPNVTAGNPVNFNAGATDPNGGTVNYLWNFGDGATATGGSVTHTFSAPGNYTVTVTITNSTGDATTTTLPITVGAAVQPPIAMSVSKLQGAASFKGGGHDSCSISGVIPKLPAGFDPTGKVISLNIGGAAVSFTLDKNGRSHALQGSVALKLRPAKRDPALKKLVFLGGDVAFTASIRNGAWAGVWSLDPTASANKAPMSMPATIQLDGNTYAATVAVTYSSKAHISGKFKK